MNAIVTLTTDFGLTDAYIAAMKGTVSSVNPEAGLLDTCHSRISPKDVSVLSTAYQYFPREIIHIVVADSGAGTERKAIVMRTPSSDFIAHDNGPLRYIIWES